MRVSLAFLATAALVLSASREALAQDCHIAGLVQRYSGDTGKLEDPGANASITCQYTSDNHGQPQIITVDGRLDPATHEYSCAPAQGSAPVQGPPAPQGQANRPDSTPRPHPASVKAHLQKFDFTVTLTENQIPQGSPIVCPCITDPELADSAGHQPDHTQCDLAFGIPYGVELPPDVDQSDNCTLWGYITDAGAIPEAADTANCYQNGTNNTVGIGDTDGYYSCVRQGGSVTLKLMNGATVEGSKLCSCPSGTNTQCNLSSSQ